MESLDPDLASFYRNFKIATTMPKKMTEMKKNLQFTKNVDKLSEVPQIVDKWGGIKIAGSWKSWF